MNEELPDEHTRKSARILVRRPVMYRVALSAGLYEREPRPAHDREELRYLFQARLLGGRPEDNENCVIESEGFDHLRVKVEDVSKDISCLLIEKLEHDLARVYEAFYFGVPVTRGTEGVQNRDDSVLGL